MAAEMKALNETKWSIEKTIGLMIDATLSYTDLQNLRTAFSLEYSGAHDRCLHAPWLTNPHSDEFVRPKLLRLPEPIPPVEQVRLAFKKFEEELCIEVSDDGKIASHRFITRMREMHDEHVALGLVAPDCGTTKERAHRFVYTFDAFPVESLSVEHCCLFSASLVNPSQSEEFIRIITAATIKETNAEINRMHTNRRIDLDFSGVSTRGFYETADKSRVYVELFITADKKAVEVFMGVAPGCIWCECGPEKRLAAAWALSAEPATWEAASQRLDSVCTHAFLLENIVQQFSLGGT